MLESKYILKLVINEKKTFATVMSSVTQDEIEEFTKAVVKSEFNRDIDILFYDSDYKVFDTREENIKTMQIYSKAIKNGSFYAELEGEDEDSDVNTFAFSYESYNGIYEKD